MQKRCNEILEITLKKYSNTIKKIKDAQRYYNSINKIIIENSEIATEKKYKFEDFYFEQVTYLPYCTGHVRIKLGSNFNYDFQSFLDDEECFWLGN